MKKNSIKQAGYYIFSFLSAFAKHYENSLFISARETFFPPGRIKKIYTYFGFSLKYVKDINFR